VESGAPPTRARRRISIALAVLGALLLLVGGLLLYAGRAIFDSEEFADRALTALEEERVNQPLAAEISNAILKRAPPQVADARPLITAVTLGVVDSPQFRTTFRDAVEHAHRTLFTKERDKLVLRIADQAGSAIDELRVSSPKLAEKLPEDPKGKLNELFESGPLVKTAQIAEDVRFLGVLLPIFGALLLALAIAVDRDRRRASRRVAIAVAVAAAVGLTIYLVGRAFALGQLEGELRDAAEGVWDAFLADLGSAFLIGVLTAIAAILVIAAWRPKPRTRPVLLIGAGLVLIFAPDYVLLPIALVAGAFAMFAGIAELLDRYGSSGERPET
jgi:hypothetical protein